MATSDSPATRSPSIAADRHGHRPWTPSVAMPDLPTQVKWASKLPSGEQPLTTAHGLAEMTIIAAADCGRRYGELFAGERAPIYGHMVLSRVVKEGCTVSAWLGGPSVEAEERAKRGLCELAASAAERNRLPFADNSQVPGIKAVAAVMGWELKGDDRHPVVGSAHHESTLEGPEEAATVSAIPIVTRGASSIERQAARTVPR